MMFRIVFWDVLPCKIIIDNSFTRQYISEDNSEHFILIYMYILTIDASPTHQKSELQKKQKFL
jgi:hypothetical protein